MKDVRIHTLWCDDIRQEVGNKLTFAGVYQADIVVPHLPATLSRIGVFNWISTPQGEPLKDVAVRVMLNGVTQLAIINPSLAYPDPLPSPFLGGNGRTTWAMGFMLEPLPLPADAQYLVTIASVEGQEVRGPALRVVASPGAHGAIGPPPPATTASVTRGRKPVLPRKPPKA